MWLGDRYGNLQLSNDEVIKLNSQRKKRGCMYYVFWIWGLGLAYGLLIVQPIKHIQFSGFRAPGSTLAGGWSYGDSAYCDLRHDVMYFQGNKAFLVKNGKRESKYLENIQIRSEGNTLILTATKISQDKNENHAIEIKYRDYGKLLVAKSLEIDGKQIKPDGEETKQYTTFQCGYPDPFYSLLTFLGIYKFWQQPNT